MQLRRNPQVLRLLQLNFQEVQCAGGPQRAGEEYPLRPADIVRCGMTCANAKGAMPVADFAWPDVAWLSHLRSNAALSC